MFCNEHIFWFDDPIVKMHDTLKCLLYVAIANNSNNMKKKYIKAMRGRKINGLILSPTFERRGGY